MQSVAMPVTTIVTRDHGYTFVLNGKPLADTVKDVSSSDYRRVELEANLEEGDKGTRPAVWINAQTNNDWQVYFDSHRFIATVLLRHILKPVLQCHAQDHASAAG